MAIPIIPSCSERDKLHEVADRIHSRYAHSQVNSRGESFFLYAAKFGYSQILAGQVPESEKNNARQFLKRCYQWLRELGHNPETLFSDEIVRILCDRDLDESRKRLARRDRAFDKLRRYHERHGFSALKNATKIVGRSFVPCLEWVDASVFSPTENDKALMAESKSETLDRILMALGDLSEWGWVKGYDCDQEESNLEEFLETARLALWMEFDPSSHFYSQKLLATQGYSRTSVEPSIEADTRQVDLDFRLYSSFSMDAETSDSYFNSYLNFRVWRLESI